MSSDAEDRPRASALLRLLVPDGVRSILRIERLRWFLGGYSIDNFFEIFWLVMLGWVALVAVILVIGWSTANYRSQIVGIWPQSASLFSKLGMAVNTRGLDFADVRHSNETEDGQPVLVITGKVVNVTGKKLDVPPLHVKLSDANKHGIYDWTFTPSSKALAPGQSVAFRTRLSNPPSAARHVELRFADGAE